MEESHSAREGRFLYSEIYDYINSGKYPTGFEKADKLALRKRAKYFDVRGTKLVYLGGPVSKCLADKDFKSLIVIFLNYRIYSF